MTNKQIFLVTILFLGYYYGYSQFTLSGMRGHLIVPSAELLEDQGFGIGVSLYPGKHYYINRKNPITGESYRGDNSESYYFFTLNFLPFIDITLNISRINNVDNVKLNGIGDRSAQFKIPILKERKLLPAISFNGEIPLGINNFLAPNALIATKNINQLKLTIGYGAPFVFSRTEQEDFYGPILGIEVSEKENEYLNGPLAAIGYQFIFNKNLRLISNVEYDGDKVNAGINVVTPLVVGSVYTTGFDSIAIGIALSGFIR